MMYFEKSNETNNSLLNSPDIHIRKGFRSFHTGNIGFVGKRASRLLGVEFRDLKKSCAISIIAAKV